MKQNTENLLIDTRNLIAENKQQLKVKGEDFNIFSITKIERYENNTHSAMFAELLNPKGSHHQGDLFLKEFLKIVFSKISLSDDDQDHSKEIQDYIKNVQITTEHPVGVIDDKSETGGRIDILLYSNKKRFIIENKIDAADQYKQIIRYCNFKEKDDSVIYLTKFGTKPSVESAGNLKEGVDYFNLSYSKDIINWLEVCLEKNGAIEFENDYVKHGIKQYLNLVKKITNRLETKFMLELKDTIKSNFEAAEQIANIFYEARLELQKSFRWSVKESLHKHLNADFEVVIKDAIGSIDSSISIYSNNVNNNKLYFKVGSFDGQDGTLYCSVYNVTGAESIALKLNPTCKNGQNTTVNYPICELLETKERNLLNMRSTGILSQFKDNSNYHEEMVKFTTQQIIDFVENYKQIVETNFDLN